MANLEQPFIDLQKALLEVDRIAEKIKLLHPATYAVICASQDKLRTQMYELGTLHFTIGPFDTDSKCPY